MESIKLSTSKRIDLLDITAEVSRAVTKNKIHDGICIIFCPHTTAGLTINENADPAVKQDIINALNKLIPVSAGYAHAEGNSDSHIKSSLFGPSLTVLVENGKLALGTWQGLYFCESDGPRNREVWVKVIKNHA
ncbi:MAG: secondary thiamine-phosphate synthase enzyme YjbQ [Candidatus Omnitrophica bacterium]|nr:secondary thiamine-phosphate synthase enzyme YjbQ [Candidatus Omnitrophota bacterium]